MQKVILIMNQYFNSNTLIRKPFTDHVKPIITDWDQRYKLKASVLSTNSVITAKYFYMCSMELLLVTLE